jgi:hypothetical protein
MGIILMASTIRIRKFYWIVNFKILASMWRRQGIKFCGRKTRMQ